MLATALAVLLWTAPAGAQLRCDPTGDGLVTDADGVNVLRASASLPSLCTLATCDADADGTITDTDGVNTLRAAASLPSLCGASGPLTLSPVTATIDAGAVRFYTAVLQLEDGGTENVTQRVVYTSSDPTVAVAANAAGAKSRVDGVAPGVVTISAVDPVSGASSTPGGNATLTVLGPLQSIVLAPAKTTLTIGESRFFTAIGHFEGGMTQNVTQRVDYLSSNTAVAEAPNAAGTKSQIFARGSGAAVISAVDAATGVSSGPDGNADLTVLGVLERVVVAPTQTTIAVGGSHFFTATGHFAGGVTQNLSQRVTWVSSNPAVASAPNLAGLKSRIDGVADGIAIISAVDPVSNVSSTDSGDDSTVTVGAGAAP
jgi:hypothetical protein